MRLVYQFFLEHGVKENVEKRRDMEEGGRGGNFSNDSMKDRNTSKLHTDYSCMNGHCRRSYRLVACTRRQCNNDLTFSATTFEKHFPFVIETRVRVLL